MTTNVDNVVSAAATRKVNVNAEQVLGAFLDDKFYSVVKGFHPDNFMCARITDARMQKEGTDVHIRKVNGNESVLYSVDEKAAMSQRNRDISTFSFEVRAMSRNMTSHVGWFLDDSLTTSTYLLMWPRVRTVQNVNGKYRPLDIPDIKDPKDFVSIDGMFIDKKTLRDALYKEGVTKDFLVSQSKLMQDTGVQHCDINEHMYLTCSTQYRERPVGLIIKRDFLRELCDWTPFTVTQDKVMFRDLHNDKKREARDRQRSNKHYAKGRTGKPASRQPALV